MGDSWKLLTVVVSNTPVSEEELLQRVGNQKIVSLLEGKAQAVVLVTVCPTLEKGNPSGYKWTSKNGPPFPIETGTVATLRVILEEERPISYLIPLWKLRSQ